MDLPNKLKYNYFVYLDEGAEATIMSLLQNAGLLSNWNGLWYFKIADTENAHVWKILLG